MSHKKPKILLAITQAEAGGAQKYVLDLAKYFRKNGYRVAVAASLEGDDWLWRELQKAGWKKSQLHRLRFLKRAIHPFWDLLAFWEFWRLVRRSQADIVHLNSSKIGLLGSIAARLAGKKVIYTAHGFVFNENGSYLKKRLYIFLEKLASHFRHQIITVSLYDKEQALKYAIAPSEKITVIHNGLDPALAKNILDRNTARARLAKLAGLKTGRIFDWTSAKIIGNIANLYPTKGWDFFLSTAEELLKKQPDLIFIILGEGEERAKIEKKIAQLSASKNIFCLGALPRAYRYLKAFDLFFFSSSKEGFPYAILEAQLAQVPIVASAVGGIPEAIELGGGILVPYGDTEATTLAIQSSLSGALENSTSLPEELTLAESCKKTTEIIFNSK